MQTPTDLFIAAFRDAPTDLLHETGLTHVWLACVDDQDYWQPAISTEDGGVFWRHPTIRVHRDDLLGD